MRKVGVVGTGRMGSDTATLLLGYGHDVVLLGTGEKSCEKGRASVVQNLDELVSHHVISRPFAEGCLSRLKIVSDDAEMADRDFIFEAVPEKIEVKTEVYRRLERVCKPEAPFISITSGIVADDLAQGLENKGRLIVAHSWNPPHLIPLVEVVRSRFTTEETFEKTMALLLELDRKIVVLKKGIPGFIGNRLMHAMYREALYLVEQGVADPKDIDDTVLYSFGQRFSSVGLLEYYDSCGLDLQYDVQSYLLADLCDAKGPQKPLVECYKRGEFGPKTGKGIYDWSAKDFDDFRKRKHMPFFKYVNWERSP